MYDWSAIMFLDQMVRERSGGQMVDFIKNRSPSQKAALINSYKCDVKELISEIEKSTSIRPLKQSLVNRFARKALITFQEIVAKYLFRSTYSAIQSCKFRNNGEVHRWMYDSFSIKRLLEGCHFKSIKQLEAYKSDIPKWTTWNLDTDPDGSIYKSESIYIEARK
jgi:hypothetical protein